MSFGALRGELEELQKAIPNIAPANAAAGAEGEGEGAGEGEGEGSAATGEEVLGKSFSFELADGTTVDAVDGTELVKSFGSRLAAAETGHATAMAEVLGVVTAQTAMLKSLSAQVLALGAAPAGRRSILSVREVVPAANTEQPLAKSEGFKTGGEAMAAADAAFKGGKISSLELAKCEGYANRGMQFPPEIQGRL